MTRLSEEFKNTIKNKMMEKFKYSNVYQIPKLSKIVLNMGIGEAKEDAKILDKAQKELSLIAGQKAVISKAKKAIAAFKIREGMQIGVMVTLRGRRMYEFAERLTGAALPRIRDFRGVPANSFDGQGNYSFGIREQVIFPEIDYNDIDRIRGLQVTMATTAMNDSEAIRLLELFGMMLTAI